MSLLYLKLNYEQTVIANTFPFHQTTFRALPVVRVPRFESEAFVHPHLDSV